MLPEPGRNRTRATEDFRRPVPRKSFAAVTAISINLSRYTVEGPVPDVDGQDRCKLLILRASLVQAYF